MEEIESVAIAVSTMCALQALIEELDLTPGQRWRIKGKFHNLLQSYRTTCAQLAWRLQNENPAVPDVFAQRLTDWETLWSEIIGALSEEELMQRVDSVLGKKDSG